MASFSEQMAGSLVRHIVVAIGGGLISAVVAKGWFTEEQARAFLTEEIVTAIVGAILVLGGVVWSYAKIKFNINFAKANKAADPGTPAAEIKKEALSRDSFQTSI